MTSQHDDGVILLPEWLQVPHDVGLRRVTWEGHPAKPPTEAELAQCRVFVLPYMGRPANAELAQRMPQLQLVQALTAGVDGVPERLPPGVTLCRAEGVHDASTAELAVGLIIAAQRGIDVAARDLAEGVWRHERRRSLADSRVVVVGWGGVGCAIGARLVPFECEVVPVARTRRQADGLGVHGADELDALLPTADVVVLAVPLAATTEHLLDARRLALLAPGALIVNVARGPVVDTDALVAELSSGRLRAALDVTDPEPLPPEHPLWRAPGVLITPHLGGNSQAFPPRAQRLLDDQLRRWSAGQPLRGVVPRG